MKSEPHEILWNRILQFQLDDPSANLKFSDKLARENNWSKDFTGRAILEYKKFILLCCISSNGASPSPIVDKVWHHHLTYTQNYWKEFCGNVLGKEIHHQPSKGGEAENTRHRNWYRETLDLYRDVFEENPPGDIWPQAKKQNNPSLIYQQPLSYSTVYKHRFYLLLVPFLLPLFFGKLHPFALAGQQFLYFYGALFICTILFFCSSPPEKTNDD